MSSNSTLYFGYGSNLWKDQMTQRCPTSSYLGIARLNGYRWLINARGYANVVQTKNEDKNSSDVVWGLVYSLQREDEARLDINEGVPEAYTKEIMTVDFWAATNGSKPKTDEDLEDGVEEEMLVYIDRKRTKPDQPREEYVYRMNMGIADALAEGVPRSYVDGVLRKFIPEEVDEGVGEFARKQAVFFRDENEGEGSG